jgi:hypothetical protein
MIASRLRYILVWIACHLRSHIFDNSVGIYGGDDGLEPATSAVTVTLTGCDLNDFMGFDG